MSAEFGQGRVRPGTPDLVRIQEAHTDLGPGRSGRRGRRQPAPPPGVATGHRPEGGVRREGAASTRRTTQAEERRVLSRRAGRLPCSLERYPGNRASVLPPGTGRVRPRVHFQTSLGTPHLEPPPQTFPRSQPRSCPPTPLRSSPSTGTLRQSPSPVRCDLPRRSTSRPHRPFRGTPCCPLDPRS